ncbi:methyl-accepting chemotaxis protein [Candidatus Halobonum tyrrellensis]|uniref:Methyl-accepting chemotaxis sensory transducer n=1 Tax=Candidatus Halobonum tyrrellensis G22 TaxID=1324957 RepID=V4J408_9EURY|nr:methyl-accepting chemotaxis protein [Candidatus Halobonum tyrrellensis]ESP90117.1 methyl-accepting chemotaxis sensory transducer [Candidatus Halobonum tyrrellensis G22]
MTQTDGGLPAAGTPTGRLSDRLREAVRYVPSGDTIPDETWAGRHRRVLISLVAHIPLLLALGLYEGTESLVTGATIPAIPTVTVVGQLGIVAALAAGAAWPRFGRRVRTALASVGLMTTSTLLVQFSGGFIEAHFHFFVVMAVIAVYEDWVPFALGLAYVAGGHIVFGLIDATRVYNHPAAIENPMVWSGIHAAFVIVLCAALMTNWTSIEKSREQSRARLDQVAATKEEISDVEEAVAEADARREEVERLNDHLERKADDYSSAMGRAADGELTVRLDPESRSEAMTQIGGAFNGMMDELESAIGRVDAVARDVSRASDETGDGVAETERAAGEVAASVEEISAGTDEQVVHIDELTGEMSQLSAAIEEVASTADEVAARSAEASTRGERGAAIADEAIEEMETIEATTAEAARVVESLDDEVGEIGEIVEVIDEIAEQTNTLALNATIEAARAGAEGEGFAVVAEEVKALATRTREATAQVAGLVEEVQASTDDAVETIEETTARVETGAETIETGLGTFGDVVEAVNEANEGVQSISTAADDQAESAEEVVAMADEVATVSEETASEAQTVSAAAEEQSASLNQVSREVERLSDRAGELERLASQFETGDDATPSERHPSPEGQGSAVATDGGPASE